jgi:hypothetical protein
MFLNGMVAARNVSPRAQMFRVFGEISGTLPPTDLWQLLAMWPIGSNERLESFFQNCSSRREESPSSLKALMVEPRHLGSYRVLKMPLEHFHIGGNADILVCGFAGLGMGD